MNIRHSKHLLIAFLAFLALKLLVPRMDIFFENSSVEPYFLSIGSQKLKILPISRHLSVPINKVDWSRLESPKSITINKEKKSATYIKRLDVFVDNGSRQATFNTSAIDGAFWKTIYKKFGKRSVLYLKITDSVDKQYASILSNSPNQNFFVEHIMGASFYSYETLSIINTKTEGDYNKDFPSVTLQDGQSDSFVPVTYISNESAQENLHCNLDFSMRSQDSLHILIKSGHGNMRKFCIPPSESVLLKSLLDQHVEETTIYISDGSPSSDQRQLGVLVISDQKKMLAVQPKLLSQLVGISINDIAYDHLYFNPANLDFVWGDIELRLTKNKEGNYHAKKRVSKSRWEKSILGSPNLLMGESLNMDSISFDFSIASQYKDTINKVKIENVHSDDFSNTLKLNLPDTLFSNTISKSIIRLDDIHNEGINSGTISLELEVYDDSPKIKEKKYQLHWGFIDTTLTQKEKKHFFSESLSMSIVQFEQLLAKEPVLTSSLKGVLDAFEFDLIHVRDEKRLQTKRVETNLKDVSLFLNTMENFKLKNGIEVGDKFQLRNFTGPELSKQEELFFEALINSDKVEKESIDESNVFLNWGTSILKTVPLLDNSRKKKIQDQIIERSTLLEIINQPVVMNRFGTKEPIVSAEWFINEDIYTKQICKTEWKECFTTYIKDAQAGDFVSLFLRTKNGKGAICQFYLDRIRGEDIIGYGNTEFDSLLFKYAQHTYKSDTSPKYDYNFVWGDSEFTLELKGNPRVFGGSFKINQRELEDLLDEKIVINSSDGEVISIQHAYVYTTNNRARNIRWRRKWTSYDFDCKHLDCALNLGDAQKLIKELDDEVYSLRVFVDQHDQSEEFVKISFIDFIIENESNAWIPQEWVSSYVNTDVFEFQFVYQEKEKTLVKLDKQNEKYKWIVDKYENDPAVEIINIPTFKTIQRAIYTKNDKGANKEIRTTEVLSKDYTNAYTLNDYHNLKGAKTKLFWKGYQSQYGGQTYCKDDFICADGELQLQIGEDMVPILRGDLIILPESGPGYKFIFDDVESMEIISILKDIPPKTNLFFENIIIPNDKGERVRLPLKFAYHLE